MSEDLYSKPAAGVDKSPGVRRIEAISSCFKKWHKAFLFFFIFLVAYAYSLDGTVRYTFQVYAVNQFQSAARISTIAVVRAVVAAAAQPVYAKISDYFGRISILIISVIFYLIGTIVSATAKNFGAFSGGAVIYQFGYTGLMLLLEVLIADMTSLRSRVLFSYIPALPFLINAWVSGNISQAVMDNSTWQWGIGMWAIILPCLCVPLLGALICGEVRAKTKGLLDGIPSPYAAMRSGEMWGDFFWQADIIGLFWLAATLALILLPFTLAGGNGNMWKTAKILAPLIIGFVIALPAFIIWEMKFARNPIMPADLMKKRQVLCALGIALMMNTAWYTQGDYLYYTLMVSFNKSITEATRVCNIYSFVSVIIGVSIGFLARYVRRLKPFIVAGAVLFIVAFGLLIRYRGGHKTSDFAGLVAAEVVLGIGGGMVPYPTQAIIQSHVGHERMAVITALFLASYSVGSGIGNTIAGAIWTNTMPGRLLNRLNENGVSNATAIANTVYADPLTFILTNPIGTPARTAVNDAYRDVQRYLTIAGICFSVIILLLTLGLANPVLGDRQNLEDAGSSTDSLNGSDAERITEAERAKESEAVKA